MAGKTSFCNTYETVTSKTYHSNKRTDWGTSALSQCAQAPLRVTPSSSFWRCIIIFLLMFDIRIPCTQAWTFSLRSIGPASLVLKITNMNWARLLPFLALQFIERKPWNTSASIVMCTNSPKKSLLICLHYSCIYCCILLVLCLLWTLTIMWLLLLPTSILVNIHPMPVLTGTYFCCLASSQLRHKVKPFISFYKNPLMWNSMWDEHNLLKTMKVVRKESHPFMTSCQDNPSFSHN